MNTLSKVFVIVNLVLAVAFCFMTLTIYAKRVDFKDRWEMEKKVHAETRKDYDARVRDLTDRNTQLTMDLDRSKNNNDILDARNKELDDDLRKRASENTTLDTANKLLIASGEAKDRELRRRSEQINRQHQIILTQQRAVDIAQKNASIAEKQKIDMENELNTSRQQLVDVQKERARLERDLHHQSWMIDELMRKGVQVAEIVFGAEATPSEPIKGKVMAVRKDVNLVMLSVGTDQGVKAGYRFIVYRSDEYIGKVEVEQTFKDMCSARILIPWTKGEIRENDDAATRVYD